MIIGRSRVFCLTTVLLFIAAALSACGGGGSDTGGGFTGGGQGAQTVLSLKLGEETQPVELESGDQTTLSVQALRGNNPVSGIVVTVDASGADVSPASLSTNSDGNANFTVTAGNQSGAATLTASVEGSTGTVTESVSFNVIGPEPPGLDVRLVDLSREPITEITPAVKGILEVFLRSENAEDIRQKVVSAQTSIGKLVPDSGTALTDETGYTYFIIEADGSDGAGNASAAINFGDQVIESSLNFSISSQLPYKLDMTLLDDGGEELSQIDTGSRFTAVISVTDEQSEAPIINQLVSVVPEGFEIVTPASGTAITDEAGAARFDSSAGQTTGAFEIAVSATFAGGEISDRFVVNVVQAERSIGYFDDDDVFRNGTLLINPDKQLSPGGSAAITVAVVGDNGKRVSTEESVTLSSDCLYSGAATLEPASPITFVGQTTLLYQATGCSGDDTITATLQSTQAKASGSVTFADIEAEAIRFEEAEPSIIAIRGTGAASDLDESALVKFKVTDINGNAVSDARVNFSLAKRVGGLALYCADDIFCDYATSADSAAGRSSRATDLSGLDGIVSARVMSGSVATPVRVLAYIDTNRNGALDDGEPASNSKSLVVTTGLPDQNSLSVSADVLNIEGAYEADGKISTITVRMADKFNNPVPDGTPATLTTELGSIVGSCLTEAGACSVKWSSQSPRLSDTVDQFSAPITIYENLSDETPNRYRCPSHREPAGPCPDDIGSETVNPPGAPRGGRSTILVTAIGEESFIDQNGNGQYDEGEYWTNLTEAFIDHNEDGLFTPAQRSNCTDPASADDVCLAGFEETFTDFNTNGVFDLNNLPMALPGSSLPDGVFNGVLCQPDAEAVGICSRELLNVFDSVVLINSFSNASNFALMAINSALREPLTLQGGQTYTLYVADTFNNPPPPESKITYEGSGRCDVITPTPTIGDTNRAGAFAVSFAVSTADGDEPTADPDQVSILLTLPSGSQTVQTYSCDVEEPPEPVNCNDPQFSPPPPGC